MKSLVVLITICAVASGSLVAQPPHHPAIVLDPVGRPLDTAEVINARALHLQAKALEGHYGHAGYAPYSTSLALGSAYGYGYSAPLLGHYTLGHAGHGLYKRSLGHYAAPAAVSHHSRVDVISSPAVVSHAVATPVYAHAAPVIATAPAAISHQSRVDVHTSPAVVAHTAVAPIAHATITPLAHAAIVPVGHHGALRHINHAAVAPIGYATAYNTGYSYYNSIPLAHGW